MKPDKTIRIIEIVFSIIGAVCAMAAVGTFGTQAKFIKTAEQLTGVVVDNVASRNSKDDGYTYAPVVEYSGMDGTLHRFTAGVSSSPPSFEVGERVSVLVSKDGTKPSIDNFGQLWFLPLFLGGFAFVFGGIGGGMMTFRIKKRKFAKYLKAAGLTIETEDFVVKVNGSLTVNGRHPYYLECKGVLDGAARVFKSGSIWEDPTDRIEGRMIRIFYLPRMPWKYHVDLDFLDAASEMVPDLIKG
ncbi:MAG: DUF3592 domain-containing protein [Fibrobacteria bacterium]